MALQGPKAESVLEDGTGDGWLPTPGFVRDLGPGGRTQLVVSVPHTALDAVHTALIQALSTPLSVLYRQVVDRLDPKPQGHPPRDFVALDLGPERVVAAVRAHAPLLHGDARCEVWVRGALGDQVILDTDGLLFCQPDDPAFTDVLLGLGLVADVDETLADRDYVKHWFRGECDALEASFLDALGLTEVAHRG